jgi:hypothetical protein
VTKIIEKMKNARRISMRVNPLLLRIKELEKVGFLLSVFNISRSRAAQQRAGKRFGGVPRNGGRLSKASALCEQHRDVPFMGPSEWLPFLLIRFLWASKENESIKK